MNSLSYRLRRRFYFIVNPNIHGDRGLHMKNVTIPSPLRTVNTHPAINARWLARAATFALLFPAAVRADTDIYGYQFTGSTLNPTTVSSGLRGSAFSYVNANPSLPPFTNPPFIVSGGTLSDDPPQFISQSDWFPTAYGYNENYYQFNVSVAPGSTMTVNSFSFSANSRQSVPFLVQIQYSTSPSFANPVSFDTNPFSIPTQEVWNTFSASDAPIVQGTGTYYFRIYAELDPSGDGSVSDLLNTGNFALNGSIQPSVTPANLYWDPAQIQTTGSGGAGTWLASNSWAYGNLDYTWGASILGVANFGGAAGGAVALGGSVNATDGLNFTTDGYTLTGNGSDLLTVGGTISTAADATISAPMTTLGNATLIKSGAATLTIAGPADFAAGTSLLVTTGTLAVTTGGAIVANGTPQVIAESPANTATLSLQGTGSFSTDNALILANTGGNATLNISDTAALSAADLIVGKGQTGSPGIGTVIQSGGLVSVANLSLATGDTSSVGIYALNGGTLAAASVTGGNGNSTFIFNGGTFQASADAPALFSGIGSLQIQSGGAILDTHGHNVTLAAPLSAPPGSTGTFTKIGDGTLTLSLSNAFPGPLAVNAGTLLTDTYTLPSSSISVAAGAVLEYNLADRVFQAPTTYTGNGTLRSIGTGQLVFGGIGVINVDFAPGAVIDVQAGKLVGSSSYDGNWTPTSLPSTSPPAPSLTPSRPDFPPPCRSTPSPAQEPSTAVISATPPPPPPSPSASPAAAAPSPAPLATTPVVTSPSSKPETAPKLSPATTPTPAARPSTREHSSSQPQPPFRSTALSPSMPEPPPS
jgi:autotransporter-associated beta strand protein